MIMSLSLFAPHLPDSATDGPAPTSTRHHHALIVGGGTAGLTVTARVTRGRSNDIDVAVIEPSEDHFYQPLWTLVGGGVSSKEKSRHSEAAVMPRRAHWIRDAVLEFHPAKNEVQTRDGTTITYDWLIVAAGFWPNTMATPRARS